MLIIHQSGVLDTDIAKMNEQELYITLENYLKEFNSPLNVEQFLVKFKKEFCNMSVSSLHATPNVEHFLTLVQGG